MDHATLDDSDAWTAIRDRGALSRVVLAAGALHAVMQMTIDDTHGRRQFGKPESPGHPLALHNVQSPRRSEAVAPINATWKRYRSSSIGSAGRRQRNTGNRTHQPSNWPSCHMVAPGSVAMARLQAVQAHLATVAQAAVAVRMAADVAVRALAPGTVGIEIAAAKVVVDWGTTREGRRLGSATPQSPTVPTGCSTSSARASPTGRTSSSHLTHVSD